MYIDVIFLILNFLRAGKALTISKLFYICSDYCLKNYTNNMQKYKDIDLIKSDYSKFDNNDLKYLIFLHKYDSFFLRKCITTTTQEIYDFAVKINGRMYYDVPDTYKNYNNSFNASKAGVLLKCIPDKYWNMYIITESVKNNPFNVEFIRNTIYDVPDIHVLAVRNNGCALSRIKYTDRTYELCIIAMENNCRSLEYVPYDHRTKEICMLGMKNLYSCIQWIPTWFKEKHIMKILNIHPELILTMPHNICTPHVYAYILDVCKENKYILNLVAERMAS